MLFHFAFITKIVALMLLRKLDNSRSGVNRNKQESAILI